MNKICWMFQLPIVGSEVKLKLGDLKLWYIIISHSSGDWVDSGKLAVLTWRLSCGCSQAGMGLESSQSFLTPRPGGWYWLLAVSQNTYMEPCPMGLPGSMVAGFQEEQVNTALSFIAQPQKADNMPFAVVTAPLRFKGRDCRCYHHPSSPVEEMSMSYHEKSMWDGRSYRELSSLPQCPALSQVSSDRSHLFLCALRIGSQRTWSLHLPHRRRAEDLEVTMTIVGACRGRRD